MCQGRSIESGDEAKLPNGKFMRSLAALAPTRREGISSHSPNVPETQHKMCIVRVADMDLRSVAVVSDDT